MASARGLSAWRHQSEVTECSSSTPRLLNVAGRTNQHAAKILIASVVVQREQTWRQLDQRRQPVFVRVGQLLQGPTLSSFPTENGNVMAFVEHPSSYSQSTSGKHFRTSPAPTA